MSITTLLNEFKLVESVEWKLGRFSEVGDVKKKALRYLKANGRNGCLGD